MILAPLAYQRPTSLDEAVRVLAENPGARVLAGGQSLISVLKLRAARVEMLVDISRLAELQEIRRLDDGSIEIGAGVTYDQVAHSEEVAAGHKIIAEVAARTVDQQVRDRGTIGGNVCHADPINNFPPLFVALGATMRLIGPDGERSVPAERFITGFYVTDLQPGEVLRSVIVPPIGDAGVGYVDIEIGEAVARAVAVVRTTGDRIDDAVVVVACLPVPVRRRAVEDALRGGGTDEESVSAATSDAAEGLEPMSDPDASADYRRAMIPVVTKRAVLAAIDEGGS
ncbi:MAG: xanthine dehydrogenase family protein subunit M [Actinobacteria bacterium]|nr:xanthine dehydrogenase family protein subunit M [Actinomycetota bacterium]